MKIKIITVGKTKERWLEKAVLEYLKRLSSRVKVDIILAKNSDQLAPLAAKQRHVICLDAEGKMMNSEEFSRYLMKEFEKGGAEISFIIGGAEGLSDKLKEAYPLISLSKMTFTHQIARLILLEQIYRAFEIAQGSKYHK